jgi:predicted transcriptional regulator
MTKDVSKVCDKKQCEVYDSKQNLIGKWNMKYIKHTYLLESFKSIKFDTNLFMDEMRRDFMARAIANYINKELPKLKLYRLVIEFIKSENTYRYPNNKSISIQSIEKYFSQINNKIDRDLIIKMCTEGYLSKSYHKVEITKKGFDLIKKIKNK